MKNRIFRMSIKYIRLNLNSLNISWNFFNNILDNILNLNSILFVNIKIFNSKWLVLNKLLNFHYFSCIYNSCLIWNVRSIVCYFSNIPDAFSLYDKWFRAILYISDSIWNIWQMFWFLFLFEPKASIVQSILSH